jgi:hypothetical protein
MQSGNGVSGKLGNMEIAVKFAPVRGIFVERLAPGLP